MTKKIGILTAGSDCSGINAAIRAIGKTAMVAFGMEMVAFQDGFKGLIENQTIALDSSAFSGILTAGGTILGTSRDHLQDVLDDGQTVDRIDQAIENYKKHKLDALVCIGGQETQEAARLLMEKGLNIISLPKSINNEVDKTDQAIGYNTALEVAAQSIDRLHSTALSNHRILIVEMMGRRAGWLALGAGIAGGADIIIIPEIPYDIQKVAQAILRRDKAGKRFSLVSVSERITSQEEVAFGERLRQMSGHNRSTAEQDRIAAELTRIENRRRDSTIHLSNRLKELTGLETRMTILGYLLRGGAPSAGDRILATQLGEAAVAAIQRGQFGVMVALRDGRVEPVPLDQVCGQYKTVPQGHPLIESARRLGISLGD